jgi:methionyl-tRNA formyltransferase
MRILFIGTVRFSLLSLRKLIEMNSNIIGVCTKAHSSFNSDFADLVPLCNLNSIPYIHVEDLNNKTNIDWIRDIISLATFRGASSGCEFAESFMLIKEIK